MNYTDDSLFDGQVRCRQSSSGYRFSLDAVLLAHFADIRPGISILDLGCGSGIVSLILAYRWPDCIVTGLEIQPDLVRLARENVALNSCQERISIVEGDLQRIGTYCGAGAFDLVVSNPPYRKTGTGRTSIDREQQVARHETMADAAAVVKASAWALKNKGKAVLIYPSVRGATIMYELKRQKLEPKRMQTVNSYPGSPAVLVLIEAIKNGGEGLDVMSPFYIYRERGGKYSPEMASCYIP